MHHFPEWAHGAEFFDAAEVGEEGGAALFAEAGKIVEDALADLLRAEVGVIGVGEAVGFVADALEQLERAAIMRNEDRCAAAGDEDLLALLNNTIRPLPGVASTETFVYLRLHKQFYNWGVR